MQREEEEIADQSEATVEYHLLEQRHQERAAHMCGISRIMEKTNNSE
jgi:hypothetical protein